MCDRHFFSENNDNTPPSFVFLAKRKRKTEILIIVVRRVMMMIAGNERTLIQKQAASISTVSLVTASPSFYLFDNIGRFNIVVDTQVLPRAYNFFLHLLPTSAPLLPQFEREHAKRQIAIFLHKP